MTSRGSESKPDDGARRPTILELFLDGKEIERALQRGVKEALLRHKKLGQSIVVCRDGVVVEIPPEQIPV